MPDVQGDVDQRDRRCARRDYDVVIAADFGHG